MLIPGGGTRGEFYLSEQLNHTKSSEIVYLDFSKTSMKIAQQEIQIMAIINVVWIRSWIENIPRLGLGAFDYVTCTGVLHHLKQPRNGLRIIKDVQPTNYGGAALMVYGKYGRTGIYQIQELLRTAIRKKVEIQKEIFYTKHFLNILPKYQCPYYLKFDGIAKLADIDIYDLLLHKRDVAYSISDLYKWIGTNGYQVVDFSIAENRAVLSPELQLSEKLVYAIVKKKAIAHQQWIAELLFGNLIKHDVYVSLREDAKAALSSSDNLIFAHGSPIGFRSVIEDKDNYITLRNKTFIRAKLAHSFVSDEETSFKKYSRLSSGESIVEFVFPFTKFNKFVVIELTKKPSRTFSIVRLVENFRSKERSNSTKEYLYTMFEALFSYLEVTGAFLVKHKSVGLFPKTGNRNMFRCLNVNE